MKDKKPRKLGFYKAVDFTPFNNSVAEQMGQTLRQHREQLGMSLEDVSSQTFIDSHYLEALENGELEYLPQGLYLRSFLKKFAAVVSCPVDDTKFWEELFTLQEIEVRSSGSTKGGSSLKQPVAVTHSSPPKFAAYLLYFFLTKAERVYLVGDLEEEYFEVLSKFGRFQAKLWFYKQVACSLLPLARRHLVKLRFIVTLVETYNRIHKK